MDEIRQLAETAQKGDQDAFGEIVRTHYDKVYGLLYRIVMNESDARDLAQQTWVKAWKKLPSFKGKAAFTTWLYRIAVFTAWDFIRKKKRRAEVSFFENYEEGQSPKPITAQTSSATESPVTALARKEFKEHFQIALNSLSEKQRTVLILREIEGLSYKEIANIMKCRIGTVMSRIHHAHVAHPPCPPIDTIKNGGFSMIKKRISPSIFLCLTLLLGISLCTTQAEAAKVSLRGTMILASNEKGLNDAKVKRFAGKLHRLFNFAHYRHYGEGSASIEMPGESSFSLGSGFRMEVKISPAPKNKIRAGVRWMKGKTTFINTVLVMQKGAPAILGGPSHEGGNLIVILEAY